MLTTKKNKWLYTLPGIIAALLIAWLAGVLTWFAFYAGSVSKANSTTHTCRGEDRYTSIAVESRDSSSSLWTTKIGEVPYYGVIYDMTVYNNYQGDIKDWSLFINIDRDCFLNEAWSGDVEIHQFVDGKENVQTINLEEYHISDVKLDYTLADQDLAIPLHKGDYIIYYASVEEEEDPITVKSGESSVGFIFFSKDKSIDFDDITLTYNTHLSITKSNGFRIFIWMMIAWCFAAVLFAVVAMQNVAARKRMRLRDQQIEESLRVFVGFVDAKDHYTNGHSTRVAEYASLLAKNMGFRADECRDIYYISLMHDCGKVYIPDNILKKPGKLDQEEYEIIKQHPVMGAKLLREFKSLPGIADGALYHHERYDGKGYPSGKKGEEIPLVARIISVVDAYDTMKTGRLYCDPLDDATLRRELIAGRGTQFDPQILDKFIELFDSGIFSDVDGIR